MERYPPVGTLTEAPDWVAFFDTTVSIQNFTQNDRAIMNRFLTPITRKAHPMTYRIAVRDHANARDVTYTVNPNTRGGYDTEPTAPGDHLSAIERAVVNFENQKIERASGNLTVEVTDISEIDTTPAKPSNRKSQA